MLRRYLSLLILLFCSLSALAQEKEVNLMAAPVDAATGKSLPGVHIEILDSVGVLVDTFNCYTIDMGIRKNYVYYCSLPSVKLPVTYSLRLTRKGYETTFAPLKLTADQGDEKTIDLEVGEVKLPRAVKQLKEATVTASKVMMVMHGDTVVYNADAFQTAEGSMLDELIAQLPGMKLERGGRITINGQFVDRLLVNGREFFKGDPTVALENLPAYMVHKIKAYQRIPDEAYLTRKDTHKARKEDPWVVDVRLKKDYSQGWIANAEAGYGTDDRYMGRLFGMHYSDRSRLTVYGIANNLNTTGSPAKDTGSWQEEVTNNGGLVTRQQGGLDYSFEAVGEGPEKFSVNTSLKAGHTTTDLRTFTASTTFLPDGHTLTASRGSNDFKATQIDWQAEINLQRKRYTLLLMPSFSYNRMNSWGGSDQASWAGLPTDFDAGAGLDSLLDGQGSPALKAARIHTLHTASDGRQSGWTASFYGTSVFKPIASYKPFTLTLNGTYHSATGHTATLYGLRPAAAQPDLRNRYDHTPSHGYQFGTEVIHTPIEKQSELFSYFLNLYYRYGQTFGSHTRTTYRLERLGGLWAELDKASLGLLPLTSDSLALALDRNNAFHTVTLSRMHDFEVFWSMGKGADWGVDLRLHLTAGRDRIRDLRYYTDNSLQRHTLAWNPSVNIRYKGWSLYSGLSRTQPSLGLMLDTRDDSDPLSTYRGNPGLRPTDTFNATLKYNSPSFQRRSYWRASASYRQLWDAVGQYRQYNRLTGAYTYTPRNIDGNRGADATFAYTRIFDKAQHWTMELDTKLGYDRSVDFSADNVSEGDAVARSVVHNFDWVQSLSFDFRRSAYHAGLKASADWGRANGSRSTFRTMSTIDMLYTLTLQAPVIWGITAATDLNLFMRRGYGDSSMNTDEWVWNASLARKLDRKGNFSLKLSAHDMLGQLSSVRRTLNAQGRTEVRTNTLTRYVMLHLIYRFSKKPKKHGEG